MRLVPSARFPVIAPILAAFVLFTYLMPAHAERRNYLLLELDGHKVKWGENRFGTPASVSYAFAEETMHFDDAINCRELAPIEGLVGERLSREQLTHETAVAFRVWERAAGLSFHKVNDPRDADIVIGTQGRPRGRAFANVSYKTDAEHEVRTIRQALVCLNPTQMWKVGFDGDEDVYDIQYTLVHEIGHAIGLDHPGPSGQVMAFRYTEAFNDLQSGDLLGVQQLYGPPNAGSASAETFPGTGQSGIVGAKVPENVLSIND
ncbi:MAG: matrixin family metalloprotease [Pseudohongiella sp.]|uniref:matrixin family metalloprotease n=1 Tax=Pseudohongiella sp. TaxID=1979412 RepID=UPI0034A04C21